MSVSLLTEMATPLMLNEPEATLANWVVLASTCRSSRMLPRTVLALFDSLARARNPLVPPPTVTTRPSLTTGNEQPVHARVEGGGDAGGGGVDREDERSVSVFLLTPMVTPLT